MCAISSTLLICSSRRKSCVGKDLEKCSKLVETCESFITWNSFQMTVFLFNRKMLIS